MTRISFSLIALSTKIDLLFHYLPGFGERLDKRLSLWVSPHRLMITRWFFLGFDYLLVFFSYRSIIFWFLFRTDSQR